MYRQVQNMATPAVNKVCRRYGWSKFLTQDDYLNQDLHDQLLDYQYYYEDYDIYLGTAYEETGLCGPNLYQFGNTRQPITFQFEFTSSTGSRKYIVGTQTRLYALNEPRGNWRILADNYGGVYTSGCGNTRFKGCQVGDYLVVTNNFDWPSYWLFDDPVTGCELTALKPIPELDDIGLTKSAVVFSWKGFVFLANVEMDGQRFTSRIVWSDNNAPLSWFPETGSFAGFQDLPYSEIILAGAEMRDYFLIYTNRAIWRMIYTGDPDAPFQFESIYSEPINGDGCLVYPNTLISLGDTHYYLSHEAVYTFSLWTPKPQRDEWVFRASCLMFDDFKEGCCEQVVAGYSPVLKEIWISYPEADAPTCCPTATQVLNIQYRTSDAVDHGFTSFGNYRSDTRMTLTDFVLNYCICTLEEMQNRTNVLAKEPAPTGEECDTIIGSLWNATEDPDLPPDADSLCSLLGNTRLEDLCEDCLNNQLFVLASATDYCLKQYGTVYNRERYVLASDTYVLDPYTSILQSGAWDFGYPDDTKEINRFEVEFEAVSQTVPNDLNLRIGYADQAYCTPIWRAQSSKALECLTEFTVAQHVTNNTRPDNTAEWPLYYEGRYLFWELSVSGTGGGVCFSRMSMDVRRLPAC